MSGVAPSSLFPLGYLHTEVLRIFVLLLVTRVFTEVTFSNIFCACVESLEDFARRIMLPVNSNNLLLPFCLDAFLFLYLVCAHEYFGTMSNSNGRGI
jgi:hypothetical protein